MPKVKPQKTPPRSAKKTDPSVDVAAVFAQWAEAAKSYALAGAGGLLVIAAGVLGVMWAGGYFGAIGDGVRRAANESAVAAGLEVRRISVMGREAADPHDLLDAVGPVLGASILDVDLDAVKARLEALGWVRNAAVRRLLPDTLQISVLERRPSAVWQVSGKLHLIDESGAVIREVSAFEFANLPLIVGAGAPDAAAEVLSALASHAELKAMTAALVRVSERRWNMRLRNTADIKLPEDDVARALAMIARLQESEGLLDQPLEYIDLSDPERMVVRKKGEPASQQVASEGKSL
jgi:cell division protein FtsQ